MEAANQEMNNVLAAALFGPKTQAQLMANQQQQAIAQMLLSEGMQPVSTNNRMIGNVGYATSPMEGMAKIAQILAGNVGQNSANEKYADILSGAVQGNGQGAGQGNGFDPVSGQQTGSGTSGGGMFDSGNLYIDSNGNPSRFAQLSAVGPNGRAVPEMIKLAMQERNHLVSNPLVNTTIGGKEGMYPTSMAINAASGQQQPQQQPQINPMSGGPMQAPQVNVPQMPVQNNYNDGMTTAPLTPVQAMPMPGEKPIDPASIPRQKPIVPPPSAPSFSGVPQTPGNMNLPDLTTSSLGAPPGAITGGTPAYGKTVLTPQQQAQLETQKAVETARATAPIEAAKAGATATATNLGEDLGTATKAFAVMQSNSNMLRQRINDLTNANKASSFGPPKLGFLGTPLAGYLTNDEKGEGPITTYHAQRNDEASAANAILQQRSAQGLLPEMSTIMSNSNMKGNKLLEGIVAAAGGLNLKNGEAGRQTEIDGLGKQYFQSMKAAADLIPRVGGKEAVILPEDIRSMVQYGVMTREEARQYLATHHARAFGGQ